MDIRGHHLEPPRDMTSLPMHSHVVSSSFKQQQHAGSVADGAQHVEVVPSASLPSIAKVKIINTGTIHAGGSHGSNGLAAVTTPSSAGASGSEISYFRQGLPPVKPSATAGGAGSHGNNVSPSNLSAGSLGNNGLTLTTGSSRPEPASAIPASSDTVKAANNNIHMSSTLAKTTSATLYTDDLRMPTSLELKACKKAVRYKECLKNHAANLGGHANDGCGEFMPSGEEGTIEALKCAACSCHRNFHRREVDGEVYAANCECRYGARDRKRIMEPIFPSPLPLPPPPGLRIHPRPSLPSSQMIMAFNSHDSDDYEGGLLSPQSPLKKRFRTKFTTEQKEKMGIFAEKLGWRMQKHDEAAVQQFCAEIGVKRHVLKVWMHNNKHALGKKLLTHGITDSGTQEEEMMP